MIDDLERAWNDVTPPQGGGTLAGALAPGTDPISEILVARDHEGNRHLLIGAPPDAEAPSTLAVKGLSVLTDELEVGDRPPRQYFDVGCSDPTLNRNFTTVAAEIIGELADGDDEVQTILERTFSRWRWFWGAAGVELTDTQMVGLFAELWFLEFWLRTIDQRTLANWTGPERDRHDFKSPEVSIEVKATRARSDGSATHRITSLDQLGDPEQGQLYLFSMRVTPDPIGANSLAKSVQRLQAHLDDDSDSLRVLNEKLGRVGYNPASHETYDVPMRVVAEELYEVRDDFPRLIAESFGQGVPNGVDKIKYSLDLVACDAWRVATKPTDLSVDPIRAALGPP